MQLKTVEEAVAEYIDLSVNDKINYVQMLVATRHTEDYVWAFRREAIKQLDARKEKDDGRFR